MSKNIVILGSTGSIGRQTLEVVQNWPENFRVVALSAGRNAPLLQKQAALVKPDAVCLDVSTDLDFGCRLLSGQEGLKEIVTLPEVDLVVVATAGIAGLVPTLAAIAAGKTIAVANKEVLVTGGHLVMSLAAEKGVKVLPIDSEHSAIWQCLEGEKRESVKRIILTASGGAFRDMALDRMARVTPAEALSHPTWSMGRKVTIDSATLLNKGLEVIEAHWLYDWPYKDIEVVIHEQSIIHSLVEFVDGSLKAQLSLPDMRLPIQYALTYPARMPLPIAELDVIKAGRLTFRAVDENRYPCLALAVEAGKKGGSYPVALNAADEIAVERFLENKIPFTGIADTIRRVLEDHQPVKVLTLEDILEVDQQVRVQLQGGN